MKNKIKLDLLVSNFLTNRLAGLGIVAALFAGMAPLGASAQDEVEEARVAADWNADGVVIPKPPVPPNLSQTFSPSIVPEGVDSTLTLLLTNLNSQAAHLTASLVNQLPAGMVVNGRAYTTCGGTVTEGVSSFTLEGGVIPARGGCAVLVPVNSKAKGVYSNHLAAHALQTSQGSNLTVTQASLTVTDVNTGGLPVVVGPPQVKVQFSPSIVPVGIDSTLTVTFINQNPTNLHLTAPFVNELPSGMVVNGRAYTTCGGVVIEGASSFTLDGGVILAEGHCTIMVPVNSKTKGNYANRITIHGLMTNLGGNTTPAEATLTVISGI